MADWNKWQIYTVTRQEADGISAFSPCITEGIMVKFLGV